MMIGALKQTIVYQLMTKKNFPADRADKCRQYESSEQPFNISCKFIDN